jgi:protein required for attachment to host cells
MQALAIVVADAARARLFTFKREPDGDPGPILRERAELTSPERSQHMGDIFSESKPSQMSNPTGRGNTYDDHRTGHLDETDRRFAAQVMARAATIAADAACDKVALVASPRFLGHLREHLAALHGLPVEEVARDLTHEPAPKLREHLGDLGVLPGGARS